MNKKAPYWLFLLFILAVSATTLLFLKPHSEHAATTKKPRKEIFEQRFKEINHIASDRSSINSITNTKVNSFDGVSEPKIALNPLDDENIIVVCNDFRLQGGNARAFISIDGGNSWDAKSVPLSGLSGFSEATDPVVAYDNLGNVFYAIVNYQALGSGDGVFVNSSADKGASWKDHATTVWKNDDATIFEDRPAITCDKSKSQWQNNVYVVWTSDIESGSKILISRSTDHAVSFSSPVTIATGNVNAADVTVGPDGAIYVAWLATSNCIYMAKSTDGALTFSEPVKAVSFEHSGVKVNGKYLVKYNGTAGVKIKSYPNIGVDKNNVVYLCYSAKNGDDLSDIFLTSSSSDLRNWNAPVRVNTDATSNDQFSPEMVIADKIYISWHDSREDVKNILVDTYFGESKDGKSFTNVKASSKSYDPISLQINNYIGDYNGITASANKVAAVWTDGRNNLFDLYTGILPVNPNSVNIKKDVATDFVVYQNYPNPFNPSTTIGFSIPRSGQVSVKLYTISGREVGTIIQQNMSAGYHSVNVDFSKFSSRPASGNYIYKVVFENQISSHKLTYVK
ncbi:MAG: T9SS type A sorting domain-containing protein [Ignavibacteria bacterium]|nr:T9SS type A sorting domain-containing protein [Ignavibacteria bacterium]